MAEAVTDEARRLAEEIIEHVWFDTSNQPLRDVVAALIDQHTASLRQERDKWQHMYEDRGKEAERLESELTALRKGHCPSCSLKESELTTLRKEAQLNRGAAEKYYAEAEALRATLAARDAEWATAFGREGLGSPTLVAGAVEHEIADLREKVDGLVKAARKIAGRLASNVLSPYPSAWTPEIDAEVSVFAKALAQFPDSDAPVTTTEGS